MQKRAVFYQISKHVTVSDLPHALLMYLEHVLKYINISA